MRLSAVREDRLLPGSYNGYGCEVAEVYCGGCELFLGHKFEDAKRHGDDHPDARWRY